METASYNVKANVKESRETVESRLQSISKSTVELLGKAAMIADKISGPQPPAAESNGQISPVSCSTLDHLRDIERTLSRVYDNLLRAENSLG